MKAPSVLQHSEIVRKAKIIEAASMLRNKKARETFHQLATEFSDFIVVSNCGLMQKAYAALICWEYDITIKVEDGGEYVRN